MKIAIIHDWLTSPGGAERVLAELIALYPEADIFTVCDLMDTKHRDFLRGNVPQTTFIQHFPFVRKLYRSYLPFMPLAIEQLDLSAYDLIISSSYAVAKGVLTGPDQLHVSYIHTPVRYAWHLQYQYLKQVNLEKGLKSWVARIFLHYIRMWDLSSTAGVDVFVANSDYVARQIWRLYRKESHVVHPPVCIDELPFSRDKQDFYMTASRLVPYKRIDLIVKAFARTPDRKLIVVGDGPERARIEEAARGHKNIEILGYQAKPELHRLLSQAKAFIFAGIEDFGIAPLEAQACGTPVLAFGKGGALETIYPLESPVPTGVFFWEQSEEEIIAAVNRFEQEGWRIRPESCRANAERFSASNFRDHFANIINRHMRSVRAPEILHPAISEISSAGNRTYPAA